MSTEPQDKIYGGPMSEVVALMPSTLNDLPVGLWVIIDRGRKSFGLEGEALADFIRRCIYTLVDAGAEPVRGAGKPDTWVLQTQYGVNKYEIAEAVITEWIAQGARKPEPWTGLWFGLPWSYALQRSAK
jgi:hypothetical protein